MLADQLLKQKEEKRRPRLTKRGVDPDKDSVRNMKIVNAVMMLTELGMIATRNITRGGTNAAEEGGSACDAVGMATGLTYRNVVRIWTDGAPASPVLSRYTQIEK